MEYLPRSCVDLPVEFPNGDVLGIEAKASSTPARDDARHLRWLREQLGDRFVGGIVIHTGPRASRFEPDVRYLPMAALWGP